MEIVERLRDMSAKNYRGSWAYWVQKQCTEAADEIEKVRANAEQLKSALETAMTTLDQIASTPRNKGAKRNASATRAFLRTQLAAAQFGQRIEG